MAVYTNDLRLKEIATGDEAGTWGTSTNTNLSLVAEAFSFGTEAITTNADTHTTTIADGSTDPGRSIFLKYTGTLDSACTITLGPNSVSKLWFIENGTSGSQSIIISQGSGANVTIPNGQTKAVYSDGAGSGAAVVDAFQDLSIPDLFIDDDLTFTSDSAVITFGADGDTTLTHTDGTGLTLNGTNKLTFGDVASFVQQSSDGVLRIDGEATIDLNASTAVTVSNDLKLDSDSAVLGFGADNDTTLTHTDGSGLTSNSMNKIMFNDASQFIQGSSATVLSLGATDEIDLTATAIDVNGTLDVSGTSQFNADVTIVDTGTGSSEGPSLKLFRDSSSPADSDLIGVLKFQGEDDGSNVTDYGTIAGKIADVTGGTEDGVLLFSVIAAGSSLDSLTLSHNEAVFNNGSADYDFRVESDSSTHALFVQASDGNVGINDSSPDAKLDVLLGATGDIAIFQGDDSDTLKINSGSNAINIDTRNTTNGLTFQMQGTEVMSIDTSGGATITRTDNGTQLTLKSTDADANLGPVLDLLRDGGSPADSDFIGQVRFQAKDDGGNVHEYGKILGQIADVTGGTEDGILAIRTVLAGTDTRRIDLGATETVINEDSADLDFRVESNNKAKMFVVDAGADAVIIGGGASENFLSESHELQVNDTNFSVASFATYRDGQDGATLSLGHSRNGTINSHTVVNNGDTLGMLMFYGSDGTDFARGASIKATVDGAPGNNDMPSRLVFSVTADGSDSPTERWRISNAGVLVSGGNSPVGIGGTPADANYAEIGAGYLNLSRDDTADAQQIQFGKNGAVHSRLETTSNSLNLQPVAGIDIVINEDSVNSDAKIETDTNANAFVVDSSSNCVIIGSQTAENRLSQQFAVTAAGHRGGMVINSFHNSDSGPIVDFQVSRNSTAGSHTVVQDGDALGTLIFRGDDGDEFRDCVAIEANVDGTPGNNDMPGVLRFLVTESDGLQERMRLNPNGLLGVGTTLSTGIAVQSSDTGVQLDSTGRIFQTISDHNDFNRTANGETIRFRRSATQVGSISVTASATAYNTSSDYRLKENVTDLTNATDRLKQLEPKRFNFKADASTTVDGFIAHEVSTIVPEAITGEKDGVDDEGNPVYQGIDQSKLVPLLVATIQELEARIAALESE